MTTYAKRLISTGLAAMLIGAASVHAEETPSAAEMWALIKQQQQEIDALKQRLGSAESKAVETDQKVEATTSYVERVASGSGAHGDVAKKATSLGGYGELHYNFGDKNQADFHRWVLFLNHDFNERVRFFSELEIEHSIAGEGKVGEVELEQAYIEFDLNETDKLRTGLFLLPIGILNETHEPTTFYGVERNDVEAQIIPSTWWEGGVAYNHTTKDGWSFDAAAHTGLFVPTTGSKAFNIRSGRQKVGNAVANDGAVTTRLSYSGVPGLKLGLAAQYQQDLAQGTLAQDADATLIAANAQYESGAFALRALYARWDISGPQAAFIGADEQQGYYIEPSYRFETDIGQMGVFARYSAYDNQAGDAAKSKNAFFDIGMNYWPIDNVVFKWDVRFTDYAGNAKDDEIINLGIGYVF